jgi:hypothetical protein
MTATRRRYVPAAARSTSSVKLTSVAHRGR